VSAGSRQDLG
jgi:hypothetical protein